MTVRDAKRLHAAMNDAAENAGIDRPAREMDLVRALKYILNYADTALMDSTMLARIEKLVEEKK